MIKWIISDMDGTLLDSDYKLPPDFDEIMQRLKEHNIKFFPASGRQNYALIDQFSKYKKDMCFISENGGLVTTDKEVLTYDKLPEDIIPALLKKLDALKMGYPVICTKEKAYVVSHDADFCQEMKQYYTHYEFVEDFSHISEPIIKIAVCDIHGQDVQKNSYPSVAEFADRLSIVISSKIWMDIMNPETSKGRAIKKLQEKWGISPDECMAFGDYYNDIQMMQVVGETYAMGNAVPEIKKLAKHVTLTNDEHGVTHTIRQYLDSLDK